MKKFKKLAALILALAMLGSVMSGCAQETSTDSNEPSESTTTEATDTTTEETGATTEEGPDLSEHVVLDFYNIGDQGGIHAQEHLDMINEYLTEKLNCELNPIMVSWGDYGTKLPLIWASGEAYDLTFTANWASYFTEAPKGAFMDITDMLPEYAPNIYKHMVDDDVIDSVSIDGRVYMVPEDNPDYTSYLINYREDLRKKYDCPEIVDWDTFEIYLKAIHDNEPSMQAFGFSSTDDMPFWNFLNEQNWSRPVDDSGGFFVYDLDDPTKVFNVVETPEYEAFVNQMHGYFEAGYIPESVMANTMVGKDAFTQGMYGSVFLNFSNSNSAYQDITAAHPDWEIGYFAPDLASGETEMIAPSNGGFAVGAFSENPERALMFLDLVYTDPALYRMIFYGIEGVTYEWDEATGTKWTPEGTDPSELALMNLGMGLSHDDFMLTNTNESEEVNRIRYEEYAPLAVVPALNAFSPDQTNISAELAALQSVQTEYKHVLELGVSDPATALDQLKEAMYAAGAEKVMDEINAQIAEYIAE